MHKAGVDRRGFLAGGAGAAAALGTMSALAERAEAAGGERPNILWLVSEDNNPYIGAYGDPLARTPTLDTSPAEGIRYEHGRTRPRRSARPSRFALITGMYAETLRARRTTCAAMAAHARLESRGLPDVPARGRLLLHEQRQDRLQRDRRPRGDLGRVEQPRPLAQPPGGRAVLRDVQLTDDARVAPVPDAPPLVRPTRRRCASRPTSPTRRRSADRPRALPTTRSSGWTPSSAPRLAELEADGPGRGHDRLLLLGDNGGVLPRSKRFCYDNGLRVPADRPLPAEVAPPRAGGARRGDRRRR